MNQTALAQEILARLALPVSNPYPGEYLTIAEALAIIDSTLQELERSGDSLPLQYLGSHRKRLAKSLSLIPKASGPGRRCLDIGSFGYMGLWAAKRLGYSDVEGVELQPGLRQSEIVRSIGRGAESLSLRVHNFDIGRPDWPIAGQYDTLLFFETLEHVGSDPVGVMANVARLMRPDSTLVMSVPNAVSYKTLQEFISGNPPWVYWFFHPDLNHEPRHSFEYTPFVLSYLLAAAGFETAAMQSLVAFVEPEDVREAFAIGADLSIDPRWFGDTLFTQAKKAADEPVIRYPACIYDAAEYYRLIHPVLYPVLRRALDRYPGLASERRQDPDAKGA